MSSWKPRVGDVVRNGSTLYRILEISTVQSEIYINICRQDEPLRTPIGAHPLSAFTLYQAALPEGPLTVKNFRENKCQVLSDLF